MQRVASDTSHPLFSVAATRQIERQAASTLPAHALMQRAGLATARLALALAPHSRRIWIACGPGNNGGDGLEAALRLRAFGKQVEVSWTGTRADRSLPPDAEAAYQRACAAGIVIRSDAPDDFDFCIDALFGLGTVAARCSTDTDEPTGRAASWLDRMRQSPAPCLAVDLPSGLNADTGVLGNLSFDATESIADYARPSRDQHRFTLSLLTLKPGLFTASGRDSAGEVWFDDLGIAAPGDAGPAACAWLMGADRVGRRPRHLESHSSHKGSFGDVAVIGGESNAATGSHMTGAVLLAARAALHAGAGRVFGSLLADPTANPVTIDTGQPEIMFRSVAALDLAQQVVVCGCGGGAAIRAVLPRLLSAAPAAVLDADALNAISRDPQLQTLLRARQARRFRTVLTPHPLEAARLLGIDTVQVQADRLRAADQLVARFGCTVVLKGSGSVIAAPGECSAINATGNALLASPGTGDVLAGMAGAALARGLGAFDAACQAVFAHGAAADAWLVSHPGEALTASRLASLQY